MFVRREWCDGVKEQEGGEEGREDRGRRKILHTFMVVRGRSGTL